MEGYFRFCICRIFPIHYSLARYRKRNPNPRVVFIPNEPEIQQLA